MLPTLPTYSVSAGGINKSNFQSVEKASKLSQKVTPEVSINNVDPTQKASESIANIAVAPVQKVAVMATSAVTVSDYTYSENKDGTLTITGYKGTNTEISIPEKIDNKTVTTIDNNAFYNTKITKVTIPDSVTRIGNGAFSECDSLQKIKIPNKVASIGDRTFYGCEVLSNITVDAENPNFASTEGVLFNKGKTTLITYPSGKTENEYVIPNTVTTIGDWAFNRCKALTSVDIPDSVTTIGDWAFYGCKALTSVTIPDSVTEIGICAFNYCESLTNALFLGDAPTKFGPSSVFSNTANNFEINYILEKKGWTSPSWKGYKAIPNTAPTLNGTKDIVITVGDSFNPMANVTASDKEDGDLTKAIVVTSNLDTTKAG
ncbi:MAG: leucine-rich repeat protein, partial [Oscillospiraceae bacterium]